MKWLNYLSWQYLHAGVIWLGIILIISAALIVAYRLLIIRLDSKRTLKALLITPPHFTGRPDAATQQLFTVLHGLDESRNIINKFLHRSVIISTEIVSTKAQGICYIVVTSPHQIKLINQALAAYLPDARVTNCRVPTFDNKRSKVIEFYQSGHFAFPLDDDSKSGTDTITYLTSAMANLRENESMHTQYVLQARLPKEASLIRARLLRNENVIGQLTGGSNRVLSQLKSLIARLAIGLVDVLSMDSLAASSYYMPSSSIRNYPLQSNDVQIARGQRPARTLSSHEQTLTDKLQFKLSQPLFKAAIRVIVESDDPHTITERLNSIKASIRAYQNYSFQTLHARPYRFTQHYHKYMYQKRLPALTKGKSNILSVSELAKFYSFTQTQNHRTDNLATSMSRTLAAPISLKQGSKLDVILGCNEHHGSKTLIGLNYKERERHVYIIGGTGNGKTTMLQYAIVQDIMAGKGVAVVDPHGDMAETLLHYIPPKRAKDVIYFNPDDLDYPIGLNLLELTPNLEGKELMREKDLITESVISVFRKIFTDDDVSGHRIEYVLRNTVQTALTVPDATLFTIYNLLNNPVYRRKVVKKLENEDLKHFWINELGKAGEMQKVKMSAGITAKIGRFLFSASAKQILEQPHSTIDFDDIINTGKILICNFSKGLLGEDTSELFGITILAKLQLASLRRARIDQGKRKPYFLYVDEFQNFATTSFVQMLSESRKYKLFLTMAEQSTSQQKDQRMVGVILANVGTIITFRSGNTQDERLLLPMFKPFLEAGDISNLPAYSFYAKLAAVKSQEPLSGMTLILPETTTENIYKKVIESSRQQFATYKIHINKPGEVPTDIANVHFNPEPKIDG